MEAHCSNYCHGSITGCPLIFEAFQRLYSEVRGEGDPTEETFQDCANLLINNVVNRPMDVGPQRVGQVSVAVQNLSARFALLLQHIYSSVLTEESLLPSVEVGHQSKVLGQDMDVTMYHATPKGPHPRVIFEFSDDDINKQYQLYAYVSNSDSMLPKSSRLIALGVVVVLSPEGDISFISFYGHYKVLVQNVKGSSVAKVSTVLLLQGMWTESVLTRVLRVCDWFVKLPMSSFDVPVSGMVEKWPTVLMSTDGNTVFKSFDYRWPPCTVSRDAALALKYLPGARNCFRDSDQDTRCTVISYPKIEGEHAPPNNKSAIGVIDGLRIMHENGDLHLDVKAGNCLFNGTIHNLSALIDYDLSSPFESATYPNNYVLAITDGKRHADAVPGGLGKVAHDTFALAAVLKLSTPMMQDFKDKWDTVCTMVQNGLLADAAKELKEQDEYELKLRADTS